MPPPPTSDRRPAPVFGRTLRFGLLILAAGSAAADAQEAQGDFVAPPGFRPTKETDPDWFRSDPRAVSSFEGLPAAFADTLIGMTPEEELQEAQRYMRRQSGKLRFGKLDTASREAVGVWSIWRAAQLTSAESRLEVARIKSEIFRDMSGLASIERVPAKKRQFRNFALGELLRQLKTLLDAGNPTRLNAVVLMGLMRTAPPNAAGVGSPPVSFAPALPVLVGVLDDVAQHDAIRAAAVRGIGRVLRDEETVPTQDEFLAAASLSNWLVDKDQHLWIRRSILEAMSWLDVSLDQARKPVVYDATKKTLSDATNPPFLRGAACRTIARIPLPPRVQESAVAELIAACAADLADGYNNRPANREYLIAFWEIYLSFAAIDEDDERVLMREGDSMLGKFLNNRPAAITAIFNQGVLPVIRHVLKNSKSPRPIPPATLAPLQNQAAALVAKP
ncbi:MAG: hypothetical protein AAF532_05230 [Planctomycetota bacterium]